MSICDKCYWKDNGEEFVWDGCENSSCNGDSNVMKKYALIVEGDILAEYNAENYDKALDKAFDWISIIELDKNGCEK